ncbi:MAG: SagB/ThcOx family dehydrogenase [Halanaerobium sp.]
MSLKKIVQKLEGKGFWLLIVLFCAVLFVGILLFFYFNFFNSPDVSNKVSTSENGKVISLAEIEKENAQLEELIYNRQSVRSYKDQEISFKNISKILWSTIGTTVDGLSGPTRAAPSAGATDPLEIFLLAQNIKDLEAGIYHYHPEEHHLVRKIEGLKIDLLTEAALNQEAVVNAAAVVIITADYSRTTERYGDRGQKYVHFEAGHAAQNVNLMAENLDLGSVTIGAFEDEKITSLLGEVDYQPLLLIPVAVP